MKTSRKEVCVGAGIIMLLAAPAGHGAAQPAIAQPPALVDPIDRDYEILRAQLAEQARVLAQQREQLVRQMQKIEEMQQQLNALQARLGVPLPDAPQPVAEVAGVTQIAQLDPDTLRGRGEEAPPTVTTLDVATVFSQPSILTPRGSWVFEPSLQYSYSSSDRVSILGFSVLNAVLIGQIDVRSVSRNNWVLGLATRYGLTNRLEVEARVPFLYRDDDTVTRSVGGVAKAEVFSSDGYGVGDIELAARYQLNIPQGDDAFYVAGVRLKTRTGQDQYDVEYDPNFNLPKELPTGSGFYSLQSSLSAVLPADPVVFFGGLNYTWNIKRDVDATIPYQNNLVYFTQHIGEVDPGDSFGLNFGMGLALNERSSFSLSYEHTWIGKTEVDGVVANEALDVQLATLQAGFSYRLSKRANLNLSVGAGLTDDTPDTTVTLRIPIRF